MRFFCLCLFFLISSLGFSQKFDLKGKIVDEDGVPLESATVYVEKIADSTLVTYTVSEPSGDFELKGATASENLMLFISYAGFKTFKKSISIEEKKEQDLGKIQMVIADNQLSEVTVTSTRVPLTLKKDTLEFNANSFTTRPNANLEDLLKKLPGVEINSDGEITVNGKTVSDIKVNGESFFGSDPKIATKNLPKEIIDKIQVSNKKTKSQEFTGKQGDPDNKSINITLKKEANKGFFGKATVGGGTDDRYALNGTGNFFKDDMRLSILANSNNINSSGFNFDDVYGMMGGGGRRFSGGGSGITKSDNAGVNYTNKWNDDIRFNGDYFFGRNDTRQKNQVQRENILPDSSYFENSTNFSNLVNDSHRGNFRVDIEFDTLTRLSISPNISINKSSSDRDSDSEILDTNKDLINNTSTSEIEDVYSSDFRNSIDFIRRFGKRGAYLQLRLSSSYNRQKNDNYLYTEQQNYSEEGPKEVTIQDQFIDQDQESSSYQASISQRSVLSENLFLDVSYDFDTQKQTNDRMVYEADQDNEYTVLNNSLSSKFESKSYKQTPNAGVNYEGDKWRINTNVGLLNTKLENTNYVSDYSYSSSFNNLYARASVRVSPKKSQSFSIDYSTNVNVPSISQLQPVEDRSSPNNIFVGNPNLSPAYSHTIRGGYRNFDFSTHSGIFSFFNVGFTNNTVVAKTTVDNTDNNFTRTTSYTNVDGAMNASLGVFYSKQTKKDEKEFRYRLSLNSSYNKNVGFTNGIKYNSENYAVNPSVRLTYAIEDLFEINPNFGISYNSSKFSISTLNEQSFINQTAGLEITTYWPKNLVFGNDISYNKYGNVSSEFDNTSILWNTSLGYQFWDKKAILNLKVYDVLDQVIDTRRSIGDDYVQDTNSLVLTQYAMLSFTYNLKTFGGKSFGGRGGRRPPPPPR
ncbi:outer membrane beta-barrel protein [Zunongwangia sp.]|uniref:outer membrane beta-barrel protein n=1 Tax=Zunongwangia sp. TaxID=1965325 RepID=UPI003AA90C14